MSKPIISVLPPGCRFKQPVGYDRQPSRKTYLVSVFRDSDGSIVSSSECVEDVMSHIIQLNFQDLVLSNLVEKGIDPHGLDMIDTNRIGVDSGAIALYNELLANSSKYIVEPSKDI